MPAAAGRTGHRLRGRGRTGSNNGELDDDEARILELDLELARDVGDERDRRRLAAVRRVRSDMDRETMSRPVGAGNAPDQVSSWWARAWVASMNSSTMSNTTCAAGFDVFMLPTIWPTK